LPLIQLLTKALANGFFPGILAISQGIRPWLIAGFLVVVDIILYANSVNVVAS
jgi:hypothetical protein